MSEVKVKKTLDKKPAVVYIGRNIKIESKGTGMTTFVSVDGKEITGVKSLDLHVESGKLVTVKMVLLDL